MGKFIDLSGQRFGSLEVICRSGYDNHGNVRWYCLCDCGGFKKPITAALKSGRSTSCGCYQKARVSLLRNTLTHGDAGSRLYGAWSNARERCKNQNYKHFHRYGGRGITFTEEWNDYQIFMEWALANGYHDDLTLDRRDNDKGYSPENCRWITQREQNRNKGNNKLSADDIPVIRVMLNEGMVSHKIAELFGCSGGLIRDINCGGV